MLLPLPFSHLDTIQLNYTIGRFNPIHLGHVGMNNIMLQEGHYSVILVGSANISRTKKNPFTYAERAHLLSQIYPNVIILPLNDYDCMDRWTQAVNDKIEEVKHMLNLNLRKVNVNLYTGGNNKGNDAQLREMWCEPLGHKVRPVHLDSDLSATLIRNHFYAEDMEPLQNMMPKQAFEFLESFRKHNDFKMLKQA